MFSFGYFHGVRLSFADVSEPSVRSIFKGLMKNIIFIKPLKMDLTEGSETSAKLNMTPGKYPKENIQDSILIYMRMSGPKGYFGQVWKNSSLPVIDPRTVQTVASRYTD
jgi:hypothetical protein